MSRKNSFCILNTNPYSDMWFANIFSYFLAFSFIFIILILEIGTFLCCLLCFLENLNLYSWWILVQFYILVMPLPGFGIKEISLPFNEFESISISSVFWDRLGRIGIFTCKQFGRIHQWKHLVEEWSVTTDLIFLIYRTI